MRDKRAAETLYRHEVLVQYPRMTKGRPQKKQSPLDRAEAELTAFGLTLPETSHGLGWVPTRALYFRKKMFFVFGDRNELPGHLTMIMKLPISAEMVRDLPFVQESKGWFLQTQLGDHAIWPRQPHPARNRAPEGLGWVQSFCAITPKKIAREVEARFRAGQ
jgi:hypothetical protein